MARSGAIAQLARGIRPDAIIERYHNFGGEAVRLAAALSAVSVLEVNAPVIDHRGSSKALLDRALLAEPMRRWREHLCSLADVIVTPNAARILPPGIPPDRIRVLEWGADTDRFHPSAGGEAPYVRPGATTIAIFAGAFRSWHGAINLVEAIKILRARGEKEIGAVLWATAPSCRASGRRAAGFDTIVFTGALPHERMPAALAGADIGVAPFDVGAHAPLRSGSTGRRSRCSNTWPRDLPVVAPAVDRIPSLVADGREGVLYNLPPNHLRRGFGGQEGGSHGGGSADALVKLKDVSLRKRLGAAGRDRAVRDYSWAAHCKALETAIEQARKRRAT